MEQHIGSYFKISSSHKNIGKIFYALILYEIILEMKYNISYFLIGIILCIAITNPAHSQDKIKVAIVDIQKIVQEADAAKYAREQLQIEFKKRQDEITKLQQEILNLQEELAQKAKFMSEAELNKKKSELGQKQINFANILKEAEMQMQLLDSNLTQQIIDDIRKIATSIAEKEGYFIVLESSQLIYVKDADDITFRIIDEYNKQWKNFRRQKKDDKDQQKKQQRK